MRNLILVTIISLTGCASTEEVPSLEPTVVEVVRYVTIHCGQPPALVPLTMLDIDWKVLPDSEGNQRFTLSPEDYERLGRNVTEILLRSSQLKAQRDFYTDCLDEQSLTNADS